MKMKTITAQYIIGLTLGLLLVPVNNGLLEVLPNIGWHFLTLLYILILLFQVLYYFLTSKQRISWTIVNFFLNFILWTAELVFLEKNFGTTYLYNSSLNAYYLSVMGGLLWTTNKVILDYFFGLTKKIKTVKSRIELRLERKNTDPT